MINFDLHFEKIIRDYTFNASNHKAIFMFGRMNPPTAGHELLINHGKEIAIAENRELFVFVSQKQDNKDDPLTQKEKLDFLDVVFPDVNFITDTMANTPFNAGYWLRDHGFTNVKMVAGSDRVPIFTKRFKPYLKHADPDLSFNFKRFKVVSVGAERDPDAPGVSGISASKARSNALEGNLAGFLDTLPAWEPNMGAKKDKFLQMAEGLYNRIREVLKDQIKEAPPEEMPVQPAEVPEQPAEVSQEQPQSL